jgi:hypothetical protein
VSSTQVFVGWDDVARDHWPQGRMDVLGRLLGFYRFYIGGGAMARLFRLQRRFAWTIMTPLVYWLGAGALVLMLAVATGLVFTSLWPQLDPIVTGLVGGAVGWGAGSLCLRWAEYLKLFWLSRIFLFIQNWAAGDDKLEAKWKELARSILRDMVDHPADEYLLLAHSVGTMVAMPVLAHLGQEPEHRGLLKRLCVVTYGQVNPLLTLADGPGVDRFRVQARLVADMRLPWLDLSAPADSLSCALTSPFTRTGCVERRPNLLIKSARFDLRHDPAVYRKLKQQPFELHFEYFRSAARSHFFHHFDLMVGRETLADRIKIWQVAS